MTSNLQYSSAEAFCPFCTCMFYLYILQCLFSQHYAHFPHLYIKEKTHKTIGFVAADETQKKIHRIYILLMYSRLSFNFKTRKAETPKK